MSFQPGRAICRIAISVVIFSGAMAPHAAAAQTAGAPPPGQGPGSVGMEIHDGLMTLKAHDAPLGQIIRAIGQRLGVKVTIAGDLDTRITRSFTAAPVDEVVRRLTRDAITAIFYHPPDEGTDGSRKIAEIRVYAVQQNRRRPAAREPGTRETGKGLDSALLAELESDDRGKRIRAVQKLGYSGESAAIGVLERVLKEEGDPALRGQAASALGRIGNERAIPALERALDDDHQAVRVQAVRALARIGGERSAEILGDVLLNSTDRRSRLTAAWSLGRLDSPKARSYLEAAANVSDEALRKAVNRSLGRWGDARDGS